jgi:hypothetical protein
VGSHTLEHRATDKAGNVGTVGSVTFTIAPAGGGSDTEDGQVSGSVPGVLAVTLGGPASFGAFVPGVTRDYTASTVATVTSSAGNAALSVHDAAATNTGRLVNGEHVMPQALQVKAGTGAFAPIGGTGAPTPLMSWNGPVGKATTTIDFKQSIAETDNLRRGDYAKTLTFTLSTTAP